MGLFVPELCTTHGSDEDDEAGDEHPETTVKPALPKGIKLKVRACDVVELR